jgi:hypothetical protein
LCHIDIGDERPEFLHDRDLRRECDFRLAECEALENDGVGTRKLGPQIVLVHDQFDLRRIETRHLLPQVT